MTGPQDVLTPQKLRLLYRAQRLVQARNHPLAHVDQRLLEWHGFSRFSAQQLKIVDKQKHLVSLVLNSTQRAIVLAEILARRARRKPWFIILKSRKHGVTTVEQALNYWAVWRTEHQFALTLAHTDDATRIIFHMVDLFCQYQPEGFAHRKTTAATHWIQFPDWDGEYRAITGGAEFGGRGATPSRVHVSEGAFIAGLRRLHKGLAESLADNAAYHYESTPNGREGVGEPFWDFWRTAEREYRTALGELWWMRPVREIMMVARRTTAPFVPLFFAWHSDPDNRSPLREPGELEPLSDEERELQRRFGLQVEQLKWWREKRAGLMADGRSSQAIHEEQASDPESCFVYGTPGYYDLDWLAQAETRCRPPIRVEDNGKLRVWEDPQPGDSYVFGVDPAEGRGAADSAIVGFNIRTRRQALTWASNRVPLEEFSARVLPDLGRRWANPATREPAFVVVERINHGHTVLALMVREAQYPQDRVYHHVEPTVDQAKPQKRPGWPHDHVQLTTEVGRMIRESSPLILDVEVVRSIREVGTGRSGAEFSNRDLAVAAALGAIGLPYAVDPSPLVMIGGQVWDLSRQPKAEDRKQRVVRTLDDLLRGD